MEKVLKELPERIVSKIQEIDSGCLYWVAAKDRKGYGRIKWDGKLKYAHRVVYEIIFGKIKDGMILDHLCRFSGCVNPYHLEEVVFKTNINRGLTGKHNSNKTHCPQGHLYTKENSYSHPQRGGRDCRECRKLRQLEWRKKCLIKS